MSITASLTRIPPEIYNAVRDSGSFMPNDEVLHRKYDWHEFGHVGIDATWYILHIMFIKTGYPLKSALEGDYCPAGGLELFSETFNGDSYLVYVSPELAKEIALELAKFPIRKSLLEYENDKTFIDYCLAYFDDLVSFYSEVAQEGDAIFITVN
jgi:hypothetical protein